MILKRGLGLSYSISFTSRPKRPQEQDGEYYHFVSPGEFQKMVDEKRFVEYNEVHGCFYGTSRDELEQALKSQDDVLLEVDVHGALRVKESFKDRCVLIFIAPPRSDELKSRLWKRGAESAADIEHRLKRVSEESGMTSSYDFCVINDDLDKSVGLIECVIKAERCRTLRLAARED